MKRLNVLIMSLGIVLSLLGAPAGAATRRHSSWVRPDGADLSPRSVCGSRERLLREEGLRAGASPRSTIALPSPRADPIGSG